MHYFLYAVETQSTGGLAQFVKAINVAISPIHLNIKKSVQEDLRGDKSCYVLVNTLATEPTKLLSGMAQWEENLFEHIIEGIVTSDDG